MSTLSVDYFVFAVKGCRDAHILLMEDLTTNVIAYEVALGIIGNTQSVIRETAYGANVIWAETPGIMNCDEFR